MTVAPTPELVVDAIAAGIFACPEAFVVEAYSVPDQEARDFKTQESLVQYAKAELGQPRGSVHIRVRYPDMGGRAVRETIRLDPRRCPGQTLRYSWNGWGLISVLLVGPEQSAISRISANSEARAKAWSSTYSHWDSPDTWNWSAVARHTLRLQQILQKLT